MLQLVLVDVENRDIFCVSASLLTRWHRFERVNRDIEEKKVTGRSKRVPHVSYSNGNSVVLE